MSTSLSVEQGLLGLFELGADGTVLYSKIESGGERHHAREDVSGRNFYDEVAPFENIEEFRQQITEFTRRLSPAGTFNFNCQYDGGALPVRVLLARVHERSNHDRTKSVLVHIRKGA